MQQKKRDWVARGHGEYKDVAEREFFGEIKGVERMVCHFYRESLPCSAMDKQLAALAARHLETKFIKVHAEKAPFLTGESLGAIGCRTVASAYPMHASGTPAQPVL